MRSTSNRDIEIIEANYWASRSGLYRTEEGNEIMVRAAAGVFLGKTASGGFLGANIVLGRTWVHIDQLHDDGSRG